ncbi:preprotein translocase subunit SecG [Spongiibacter sp. KMU-166]|uniref:Protein-export membrane protein SecG n=1 Tax=Spongiibacter thalassae TaxID=2721624 RepID=A0ABX1GLQ4_9GAMM|nr:preprotein translocase subunit SecG [Spongiibacter thalassae]NKI19089.1 preprotein translocase subunit SecG [Spongiibacter thalassae]
MEQIILIVHVLAALAIIGLILVQQGKGADMGASFGAGASQTLFGSSGSGNVLTRATAILATLFFATSLALAYVAKDRSGIDEDIIDVPVLEESREVAPVPSDELPVAPESDMPAGPESDIPQ